MLACQEGHQSIVILLLEKGADKQLQNKVSLYIIMYIYNTARTRNILLCTFKNQAQYQ